MPIILNQQANKPAGGILLLADVIAHYPKCDLVLYNRVSSYSLAGKGKVKLIEKTDTLVAEIENIAPGRISAIFYGVELGQISERRPTLTKAIAYARAHRMILCARNLARLIRSEDYDRQTNSDAEPTFEEWKRFWKSVGNLTVATLDDPTLTEPRRHALDTNRGHCGRPPEPLDRKITLQILESLGMSTSLFGRIEWEVPIAVVAKRFDVAPAKIQRLLDSPVPGRVVEVSG